MNKQMVLEQVKKLGLIGCHSRAIPRTHGKNGRCTN